jgi:threonine aldolase
VEDLDDLVALGASCERHLQGNGPRPAGEILAEIPPDTEQDRYGEGGVVATLEARAAGLLGKQAACQLVTGTMAQQIALRVHADRRGRRTVAFHPACHLDWHEGRGYERLHHLVGVQVGALARPLALSDLAAVHEPPAALVIELPQRDLGGHLPSWSELGDLVAWARAAGAAVHMDGARLWEAQPFYDRPLAEIAALFDTVYVSFYKGLGALAGCCVAGDQGVIGQVREWRRRHGGTAYSMWPSAASAMAGLDKRLPQMRAWYDHARAIAEVLAAVPGVRVVPEVPCAPMMHLFIDATTEQWSERFRAIATEEGISTWPRTWPFELPGIQRVEFSVGEATMSFSPDEVGRLVRRLAGS